MLKKVHKHTVTGIQQNCWKCRKCSKIKQSRRFNIDDKSIICLPRQEVAVEWNSFDLCELLDEMGNFYNRFTTFEMSSDMIFNIKIGIIELKGKMN